MRAISLPDISDMNSAIADAASSIKTHEQRVSAFNKAFTFVKTSLSIVI
jgi:hypothetical protein